MPLDRFWISKLNAGRALAMNDLHGLSSSELFTSPETWHSYWMAANTADSLGYFVEHLTRGFTPELARHFSDLPQPDAEFQARLDELAGKANEGALSAGEAEEYAKFVEYMDFVALLRLKSKAKVAVGK